MKFKHPEDEQAAKRAHPSLRAVFVLFEDWSRANHLPEPEIADLKDKGLRQKFSWHKPDHLCAADFRVHQYTPAELDVVEREFFERYFRHPMWELLTTKQPHGTGPHIHLARRDISFKPQEEAGHG